MSNEYKLVPVEPTDAMLASGREWGPFPFLKDAYVAMLAAAPQPPALGGEPEVMRVITDKPCPVLRREHSTLKLHAGDRCTWCEGTDFVVEYVEQAPALGGDPDILGYSVKGNRYAIRLTKGELLELCEGYKGDALIELIDRAHLAPLQAEIAERWEQIAELNSNAVELKAEIDRLTTAQLEMAELYFLRGNEIDQLKARLATLQGDSGKLADPSLTGERDV